MKKRTFTAQEKVTILRKRFLENQEVSDICNEYDINPSVFYRWQKEFFENGANAFEKDKSQQKIVNQLKKKVGHLESKLETKNEVLVELMEEHILLKKKNGAY